MSKVYIVTGPDQGQYFDLSDKEFYIGRSSNNAIQIRDRYVSRRHLKVIRRRKKYFIVDLESKNGTLVEGRPITPGVEIEVKEGIPIIIGMTVVCIGEECSKYVQAFLASMERDGEIRRRTSAFVEDRPMTGQKNRAFMQKVSDLLIESTDLDEMLENMAIYIFDILKRIDRVAIVLFDKETGAVSKVVSKTKEDIQETAEMYSADVVDRVVRDGKSVVITDVGGQDAPDITDTLRLYNIGSVMCVPLMRKSEIRGVIYVDSLETPFGFRKEDLSLFAALSSRAAPAIENALF
jgi:pSer/pThr/pTyr-binding forkhead associated (FHA) protein